MITLSLLQYLSDNGFGTIDQNLFWQKLPLSKKGIFVLDIGQAQDRGMRRTQRYELYSRGNNDIEGYENLVQIINFLNDHYGQACTLPKASVYAGSTAYENVTIMPLSTPTNVGEDANGRIIWSTTGELKY